MVLYSAARDITEKHAKEIKDNETVLTVIPGKSGTECIIAEADGTMVPIVDTSDETSDENRADRRRIRKCRWKEARLTLTHPEGSVRRRAL